MNTRKSHPNSQWRLSETDRLSWDWRKETAEAFHTSWDQVCDAVEYVVGWGLEHRTLQSIRALGVDEIQYAKGHKYLTLVYQIDQGLTRLLWVGKERTLESFQGFFTVIGEQLAASDRVCLLRHVAALLGRNPPEMLPGAAHPRSLPHRRQDE